jgi:hypothetical protein
MVRGTEHPSSTHAQKIILINKCGNKLKHENEAEGPRGAMALSLVFVFKFISTFNS